MQKNQDGRTHWPECWRERGHHECAIALIEELTQDLNDARNGWEGAVEAARDMADTERVIAWIRDPNRGRAVTSFTEGPERQIAYAVEDVFGQSASTDKPEQELPGSLALQQAVKRGEWPHTMDADVWAEEFLKHFQPNNGPNAFPDRADMIGWFANAIMAGYDTAMSRAAQSAPVEGDKVPSMRTASQCVSSDYAKGRNACREEMLKRAQPQDEHPVPMLLFCPKCSKQHIDQEQPEKGWSNPPHRSHECQHCGYVWRPSDVATTGVASIATKGKRDRAPQPNPKQGDEARQTKGRHK